MKKKIHILPNIVTAFGLSCGLFAIFKIIMLPTGHISYDNILAIAGILLLAAFADLLDGAIARAMKAESEFGGLFDSLADAITFGVGPSVVVLKTLAIEPGTELSYLLVTAAMIFTVCGVLRLVRFNITNQLAKGDVHQVEADKKNFTGLPIPAAASAIIASNLLLASDDLGVIFRFSNETKAWILFFQLVLIGYFMISRWKFPSLKSLHIRVASFQIVFLTVISAVLIFYGIIHKFALVFFLISWAYIAVAWCLSLARVISGRKSKTLEDYEPEPDELDIDDKE